MDSESPSLLRNLLSKATSKLGVFGLLARIVLGHQLAAIAWLTMKSAFRYKLFIAIIVALALIVIGLPMGLKSDGTAQGLTRILLTYTLGSITVLMAVFTMWLSCGALARDIDECQIQTLAVKPVARWQIWLGKLIGILTLNAMLLGFAGCVLVGMIEHRASQLTVLERQVLENEVLVGRGVVRMPKIDYAPDVEKTYQAMLLENEAATKEVPEQVAKGSILAALQAQDEVLPSGHTRVLNLRLTDVKDNLKDLPLFMKLKFFATKKDKNNVYYLDIVVGPPGATESRSRSVELPANTVNTITLPPNLLDDEGNLRIEFSNLNESDLLIPIDGGLEVLFREHGFAGNFFRGMAIIFLWLALLATIGLAASSLLSFPVAAFFSMGVLIVGLSGGTLSSVVEKGATGASNHETGAVERGLLDPFVVTFFAVTLKIVNLVESFSPIESLSEGRSITWGELGKAVFQIGIIMGGFFSGVGMVALTRRELATAQSHM